MRGSVAVQDDGGLAGDASPGTASPIETPLGAATPIGGGDGGGAVEEAVAGHPSRAAARLIRGWELVSIGLLLALAAGWFEVLYWTLWRAWTGELIFLPDRFVWMAPLAQIGLFAVPTLLMLAASRCVGHKWTRRAAVITLSGLAWLNVLFLVAPLHWYAYGLLAAGLASATGNAWHRLGSRSGTWAARGALGLLVGLAAAMVFQEGGRAIAQRRRWAALPGPPADVPNVLLIVLDTVRADLLGCYGNTSVGTPQLDRWSKQGTLFERAQATAPWTLPSHGGMFTGHLPHDLSGDWMSPLDDRFPTLAEHLQGRGYATAGFVANTRYCSRETGLARGFLCYRDFPICCANLALCTAMGRKILFGPIPALWNQYNWPGRKTAATVNREFLDWQAALDDRPFFAYLNYWDAHDPYLTPAPQAGDAVRSRAEKRLLRDWWWIEKDGLTDIQVTRVRAAHAACLRYLDEQLGRLFESLEARGLRENTLVILTADHGEHFGEHGLYSHGNSLYQPLLHVPLIFVWPDHVPAGRRVAKPVSLARLPSTVAALVGAAAAPFPGGSLAPLWRDGAGGQGEETAIVSEIATQAKFPPCHGHSPIARGAMQSVLLGPMKYIRNGDGEEELYDLLRDPAEAHNLAGRAAAGATLEPMRAALARARATAGRRDAPSPYPLPHKLADPRRAVRFLPPRQVCGGEGTEAENR